MRPAPVQHVRQQGATLLVSMIMLLLITMLALTSFRLASGNLKIVGNMQQRNQVLTAAQNAVERVVSNPLFSHELFGVYLGLMVWAGLWLRDPRLRAMLPLRR